MERGGNSRHIFTEEGSSLKAECILIHARLLNMALRQGRYSYSRISADDQHKG